MAIGSGCWTECIEYLATGQADDPEYYVPATGELDGELHDFRLRSDGKQITIHQMVEDELEPYAERGCESQ